MFYNINVRYSYKNADNFFNYVFFINFLFFGFLNFAGGSESVKPNIILIIADDLGWMDVGFHGSNDLQTPNIDALAYHGVSLHKHYALPTCTPSRMALLTGRYPIRTGIHHPLAAGHQDGIPLNETLLPQYLKQLGYATHLVGKWHLGYFCEEYLPTSRGFDSHFGYYSGYIGYYDGIHLTSNMSQGIAGLDAWRNKKPVWTELAGEYATKVFTNEAIKVIESHDKNSPLFLQVAHLAPHSGNMNAKLQVNDVKENDKIFGYIKDQNRRLYAGMVKELDKSVGNIMKALEKKDLLKNSVVIFISDNGAPTHEPLWDTSNHGSNWPLRGEKGSLHEGGVRTVGAIWTSHLLKPSFVYKKSFHIVDWLPTLFAAAGGNLGKLKNIDGKNQWENIINNPITLTPGDDPSENRSLLLDISESEALISGKWKIIKNDKNSSLSFTNYYYGVNGSGEGIPDYNITAVLTSKTSKVLNSISKEIKIDSNDIELKNIEDIFMKLRAENKIDCKNSEDVKNVNDCFDNYCLFNLDDDPCEKNNLVTKEEAKFNELHDLLNYYRNFDIKVNVSDFDEKSLPKYWNNYWTPWVRCADESNTENFVISKGHDNYVGFLTFWSIFMVQYYLL